MENIENGVQNYENVYETTENEVQADRTTEENTTFYSDEPENPKDELETNEVVQENTVVEDTSINLQNEKLDQIHQDLGIICSFLIIFALVIVFKYVYKFFNMFF